MSDEQIKKQIIDQYVWDSRLDASKVDVTVDNGRVTIKGAVPTYRAKDAATQDAYLIRGVKWVDNQLVVQYETKPTDDDMRSSVKGALFWDVDINSDKVDVSVLAGWVTLRGTVDAYWKKRQAEDDAYGVSGVIGVTNELAVVPTQEWEDERIAKDVQQALERNMNIVIDTVDVVVENGHVTLNGTVGTWVAYDSAERSARFTGGVVDVTNNITVEALE